MQQDRYFNAMRDTGLRSIALRSTTPYRFPTISAQKACATYDVTSVSILAFKD